MDQPEPSPQTGDDATADDPSRGLVGDLTLERAAAAEAGAHAVSARVSAAVSDVASRWADICPYLFDTTGTWRTTRPTNEHRCTALTPPAPLRADKQRRHCLVAAHVECPIYVAARDVRGQTVGNLDDPGRASRRGYARTAPVLLERPAAAAVALSTLRTSLPQVGLIVLMLLAVAALVLARYVSP